LYVSEIETPFSNLKREVKAFRFVQINRDVARRQLKLSRLISRTRFA
jgi:hypothetical protein